MVLDDGRVEVLDSSTLLAPIEKTLRALSWTTVALALSLVLAHPLLRWGHDLVVHATVAQDSARRVFSIGARRAELSRTSTRPSSSTIRPSIEIAWRRI